MFTSLAGLLGGAVHALSGPAHLAALSPLAAERPHPGWRLGLWWGAGHSTGVLIVGLLFLALRGLIPLEAISGWSERLVGVVLIGIGLWGLRRALPRRLHAHEHTHDGVRHTHVHLHGEREAHAHHDGRGAHTHSHLSLSMGILHGFAGSAHVLGVLPALAFPTQGEAIAYLLFFGAGTILAMGLYTWFLAWSLRSLHRRGLQSYRVFLTASSVLAIAVGAFWLTI